MKTNKIISAFLALACVSLSSCQTNKSDMEKIYDFYDGLEEKPVVLDDATKLEIFNDLNYGQDGFHVLAEITVERKEYEIQVQPKDTVLYTNLIDYKLTLGFASCAKPEEEGHVEFFAQDCADITFTAKYGDGEKTAKEVEKEQNLQKNFFTTDKDCNIVFLEFDEAPITRTLVKLEAPRVLKLYKSWLQTNGLSLEAVNGLANLN